MARPELVRQLSVTPQTSLLAAIDQITKSEHKILLIVGDDGQLRGVVTDYDIRQAILNKFTFEQALDEIIKHRPVIAQAGASDHDIIELMQNTPCMQIPIVDANGRPVDVRFHEEFVVLREKEEERVAVVMAGGLGTRLHPITEHVPKPLLEISGRPILFVLLDQIISEGFNRIYLTLHYKSKMFIDRVHASPRFRDCVEFVVETKPLGTAGSLGLLPRRPANPFLIINADLLTEVSLHEMYRFHIRQGNMATIAVKREKFEVPYGVVETSGGVVVGLREKPELPIDVNTGVYVISPSVLDYIPQDVGLDMPQLLNQLIDEKRPLGSFPVHEFWLDVGTHEQLDRAMNKFTNHADR